MPTSQLLMLSPVSLVSFRQTSFVACSDKNRRLKHESETPNAQQEIIPIFALDEIYLFDT